MEEQHRSLRNRLKKLLRKIRRLYSDLSSRKKLEMAYLSCRVIFVRLHQFGPDTDQWLCAVCVRSSARDGEFAELETGLWWFCAVQLKSLLGKSGTFTETIHNTTQSGGSAELRVGLVLILHRQIDVDLHVNKICSVLDLCAYLSNDCVNHYSPACSPFPSQRRPLHSLPASSANSPAPRWSLCPPARQNTFTATLHFPVDLLYPVMGCRWINDS